MKAWGKGRNIRRNRRAAHWGFSVALGIGAAILLLAAFTAQGQPSSPSASLSGAYNPSQAQNLQVTLTSQVDSITPPNSIYMLGGHFLYSISQTNAQGGTTVLESQQTVAFAVVNSSGSTYTVSATVSISTTAACTGTGCDGMAANLTVTVQSILSTYWGVLVSPTSHVVFSNTPKYQSVPAVGTAQNGAFLLELVGPILGAVSLAAFAVAANRPHPAAVFSAVGSGAIALILLLLIAVVG